LFGLLAVGSNGETAVNRSRHTTKNQVAHISPNQKANVPPIAANTKRPFRACRLAGLNVYLQPLAVAFSTIVLLIGEDEGMGNGRFPFGSIENNS